MSEATNLLGDLAIWHRLQFAFTVIFHYLFPQLTMGLGPFIVWYKWRALRTGEARYADAARFWIRVFGINFAVGVVTGIPMEFQFGTNWARFTHVSGGVIGQTLGMEGLFAFFLESAFLYFLIFGEKRLSARQHFATAVALFVGSWLSGYFIIVANAFMQHPTGWVRASDGTMQIDSFGAFLFNRWALAEYAHNMMAALVTGSFVVAAVGAWWTLAGRHTEQARLQLIYGVRVGLVASILVAFPTGDRQAKLVAEHQPATLAAMEGRFESGPVAGITILGQPNIAARRLDNPIRVPGALSFLAYGTFHSDVRGLNEFPEKDWPTNIELLYYAFHIMAGLGTLFIGLMGLAWLLQWRRRLERTRLVLWALMLAAPFPYIANTAGWMTAELGRQPWLIHGLMRTVDGASPRVHAGETIFTMIGFTGLYLCVGLLYLFLVGRVLVRGPVGLEESAHG